MQIHVPSRFHHVIDCLRIILTKTRKMIEVTNGCLVRTFTSQGARLFFILWLIKDVNAFFIKLCTVLKPVKHDLSRHMGKPTICIGENKGADQLRSNCEADQRLCFRNSDSTIPLLRKSEISSF